MHGIAHGAVNNVELAVEEVFVNIALYAYEENESSGEVTVCCVDDSGDVFLEFTDRAAPFDPLKHGPPTSLWTPRNECREAWACQAAHKIEEIGI